MLETLKMLMNKDKPQLILIIVILGLILAITIVL